ncbi:putative RNA-directed DNA polymerase from transposon BS [Trichonephila clavipes]|nr:putative RNA-directed DNA polymerase from transposon BS [Trichonephila clavipes]
MSDIFEIQHDSHLLVYADDIFLYNSGTNWNKTIGEMLESLNKISVWCKKWKLATSPEKSSLINFSRKRSAIPPLLKICDKPIPEVKSLKILGIIFDPNITWKNHINYLRQKGFKYLNAIKALSSPKIGTRSDHLLNIINATIRSIFDYGSQLFSFSSNSNRQKLEPIYNAALRLAPGLPRNTPLDLLRAESMNGSINTRHNFLCQKFITKQIPLKDWSPNARRILEIKLINSFPPKIIWRYGIYPKLFDKMSDIEFHEGMSFDVEDITNAFVIIDDLMNEVGDDKRTFKLVHERKPS